MYRRVLRESFNVSTQVANATTRLLASYSCYEHLRGSGYNGLQIGEIVRPLRLVLDARVNSEDIHALGHFCIQQVSIHDERSKSFLQKVRASLDGDGAIQELSGHGSSQAGEVGSIGCTAFARAHASSSMIDFDDVTKLFDKERNVGVLERLFTPGHLWKHIHSAKRAQEMSPSSGGGEIEPLSEEGWEEKLEKEEKEDETEDKNERALQDLKTRLETLELHLATSERSLADWKQKSVDLACTCAHLEEKLEKMELRLEQCSKACVVSSGLPENGSKYEGLQETSVNSAEGALMAALPSMPSSLEAAVAKLSELHTNTQADVRELDARMLLLQRQVLIANSDISGIRRRCGITGLPTVPSKMSPPKDSDESPLAKHGALWKHGGSGA